MVQPLKACWNLQEEISPEMRKVLVEWLCDLCVEFKLEQETFFLMVSAARAPPLCPGTRPAIVSHSHANFLAALQINYLDRYLGKVPVTRANFQLVGIAALWLAAKFEEVSYPSAAQLLDFTDDSYK